MMNILYAVIVIMFLSNVVTFIKMFSYKKKNTALKAAYKTLDSLFSLKKTEITDQDVHKENFIKFLSDSRESAYEYIESVQNELSSFVTKVDPLISYFDEYGDAMGMVPNYDSMKQISLAYKELIKLLPEEEQ